jgi:regulator of nucleoside diphosphate kinase
MQRTIHITEPDMEKLAALLQSWRPARDGDREHAHALAEELERAQLVERHATPEGVVTMNSSVTVTDLNTGRRHDYTIVFPRDANLDEGRISVLAPVGTALLGYAVGDEIEWKVPGGVRRLRIEAVQPSALEAAAVPAA